MSSIKQESKYLFNINKGKEWLIYCKINLATCNLELLQDFQLLDTIVNVKSVCMCKNC